MDDHSHDLQQADRLYRWMQAHGMEFGSWNVMDVFRQRKDGLTRLCESLHISTGDTRGTMIAQLKAHEFTAEQFDTIARLQAERQAERQKDARRRRLRDVANGPRPHAYITHVALEMARADGIDV